MVSGFGLRWTRVARPLLRYVALGALCVPALAAPPYKHYVLAPEHLSGDLSIVSLEPGNSISTSTVQRNLGAYETATIPASELAPGTIISGTAQYSVGSTANATDLLAPDFFAGTSFVIPHITGSHKYYVQATAVTANLTIQLGATTDTLQINPGTSYEIDAGSDNAIAGRITSDQPIVVAHVAYVSGAPRDAYPVPPASVEVVGIRSQNVVLGAGTNGTSITVYASDGTNSIHSLNAGEKVAVTVGANGAQGAGSAVRIVASQPVAAVQYDDGDGSDATAFWPASAFARRHGIPVNAQYVAVACLQAGVSVTLFKGNATPETQVCSSSGTDPGKVYFGSGTSGSNIPAGWYLHSSAPVYAMYEAATPEDEHNLSGAQSAAGPSAPTLSAVSSPTTSNPVAITGTSSASATVRLYVNGRLQQTTTASGAGAFSFNAELYDGNNVVHAVAADSGNESNPSNIVEVVYSNTVPRTQSGTISSNSVWTPGSPATPYVISANLTVAAGVKLVIQPGTTLKLGSGVTLIANGTLKIAGTAASPVLLTSNAASPTRGSWEGVTIGATSVGSEISYATFEWATTTIAFSGGSGIVRNSIIRNFQFNGVYHSGAGASGTLVLNNVIDNGNDTGDCIDALNSSPTIQGNTLTNCEYGINIRGNSSPTVNQDNIITGNVTGILIDGQSANNPDPLIAGNRIYTNNSNNLTATAFTTTGSTRLVRAQGNWWGTTEASPIRLKIYDLTNDYVSTRLPTVDWSNYLNAAGGTAVPGNFLFGHFAASTTLTAGTTYQVLGALFVDAGKTLTVQAGTVLRFHGLTRIVVDGTLTVQGVNGTPAILTSGRASQLRGDWEGIMIRAGSGSLIEYAQIDYANFGLYLNGVAATIRHNSITHFAYTPGTGIYVKGAGASGTQIVSNYLLGDDWGGRGIQTDVSSPTITNNTITNTDRAVYIVGANTSSITGNILTGNDNAIYIDGSSTTPQPVATGNQLHSNRETNYFVAGYATGAQNVRLNATGNWWGTTDPVAIAAKITDWVDAYTSVSVPVVNFAPFLDGPGGTAVPGNYLLGPFAAASTTLTVGATYEVVGTTMVQTGKSLIVPAGTVLRFHGTATTLVVDGTLTIQGTAGNLVQLTTANPAPTRGNWEGILIRAGTGTLIEYAQIDYANVGIYVNGVAATIRHNSIRHFAYTPGTGIYVKGAGASGTQIVSNYLLGDDFGGRGIVTDVSSPTITGNTITNTDRAIYLVGANTSSITGNIITGNDVGIYVEANTTTPQPVVNGNQIHTNNQWNYFLVADFATGAQNVRLNATGNWWGTTNALAISDSIRDRSDETASNVIATVDYTGFLDGPGGGAVPGNYLFGSLTATTTTLTAGATYEVPANLIVPSGKTLVVPAGITLRFHGTATTLVVDGTLTIQGTVGNLVQLTTANPAPTRGNWEGILIRAGTGTLIEYAQIDYANVGIYVNGVVATIRHNSIRHFAYTPGTGIYVKAAGASGTQIVSNYLQGDDFGGRGIVTDVSSPTITNNTITNTDRAIYTVSANTSSITGNIITANDYGIYVEADGVTPQPVATGNQIHSNNTQNYHVVADFASGAQNVRLNATGNWWGTTDPVAIAAEITDLSDNHTSVNVPTVDFSGFLSGPGGSAVPGNYLIGPFAAASTTLTAGTTYEVLGMTYVPAGKTLTVQGGAQLNFNSGTALIVDGTLQVQGTASARARFTSAKLTGQANGDWVGIVVRATATNVVIDNAIIEWMVRGVDVQTATVTISNSIIRNFSENGIRMTGVSSASAITNNYIDNYSKTGEGIYLSASSPSITGNRIYRTNRGIYLSGASNPVISGNILTGNNVGIYLFGNGSNSATAVPRPTITGNDIFGNTNAQVEVNGYGASNPAVINATGNWWGTATPAAGTQIKFTGGSPAATLNFSSPAAGPLNGATGGDVTVSDAFFSPNGDSIEDTTIVQGTLTQASNWTVNFLNGAGAVVRTLTGSGTSIAAVWNGQNGGGVVLPDGTYDVEVSVPSGMTSVVIGYRLATIDNTPPQLVVSNPPASSVIQSGISVGVNGTASDVRMIDYTLEFGAGTSPSTWTTIQTQTAAVSGGLLGNWSINSIDGSFALPAGPYTLRLRSADIAGNSSVLTVPVTLDTISVSGVTQNLELIRPLLGEELQVGFTLSAPGTAYLRIYPEQGGALVKEVSEVFATAGPKTLAWNGRNTGGARMPDEAYNYVLHIQEGLRTATYDPEDSTSTGSGSGTIDPSYNPTRNDFWKMNYALVTPKSRVRMQVTGCGITGTHYPYDWVPFLPGTFPVMWDGRDQNGKLVSGTCEIYFDAPDRLKPASVIIKGIKPVITGTGASPGIEVKSNPFKATHSYEQVSKITYRIDQDSYVTVKILPPGISDPASPEAIVLVNNVASSAQSGGSPVDHVVEWKGHDAVDTNNILVSTDGTYTFTIQATSVGTGITTLYRGALQLYQ